jgi:predicted PurR-regulated permease PerM
MNIDVREFSGRALTQQEWERIKLEAMAKNALRRKVIKRKAANISSAIVTVVILGLGVILGPKAVSNFQQQNLIKANKDLNNYGYERIITDETKKEGEIDYLERELAEASQALEYIEKGSPKYFEYQQKVFDLTAQLEALNTYNQNGPTK